MQADSSLEESKVVSEPPKSRPDYTLAVRRRELRFKNHHPDPRTSRYGQRLVEEIQKVHGGMDPMNGLAEDLNRNGGGKGCGGSNGQLTGSNGCVWTNGMERLSLEQTW